MSLLSSAKSALSGAAGSAAGSLAGGITGAASKLTYSQLKTTYMDFESPQAAIFFANTAFNNTGNFIIDDIYVEVTSDFEASVATFRIYNIYDQKTSSFLYAQIKQQVCIGNVVDIVLGYLGVGKTVFHGFISGLDFHFDDIGLPYLEVTCMDIKGVMMASSYAQQISAASYSAAVEQIFARSVYASLMQGMSLQVTATPDASSAAGGLAGAAGGLSGAAGGLAGVAGGLSGAASGLAGSVTGGLTNDLGGVSNNLPKAGNLAGGLGGLGGLGGAQSVSATTIEMVAESDYEFVVKAAKRYNYEFFADKTTLYFRPAKSDTASQAELAAGAGILEFSVGYSISGLVGEVETRSVDAGTGKLVKSNKKLLQDAAIESKARALVGGAQKVYIDASIQSQQDADSRANSLYEQISYRLGSFEATCVGIPDLSPGRFIDVKGMGAPADNSFYITTVIHQLSSAGGYRTRLIGKTAKFGSALGGAAALAGGASSLTGGASSLASGLGGLL